MMKVKVLESFIDKYTGDVYEVGDVVEMDDGRVEEILSNPKTYVKIIKNKKEKGLK